MRRLAILVLIVCPAAAVADEAGRALSDSFVSLVLRSVTAAHRPAPAPQHCGCGEGLFCKCFCTDGLPCDCAACPCPKPTYEQLRVRAIAEGKPLLVWVGVQPSRETALALKGCLQHRCATFAGVQGSGVVVSRPNGNWLEWLETLPADATVMQIGERLSPTYEAPPPPPTFKFPAPVLYQPRPVFRAPARGGC
jgi:hypothetical protein